MSVKAMGQAWGQVEGLPPRQFIVLLAIADVVNDAHDNLFWMPSANLAKKAGASRATAAAALSAFVEKGWLDVVTPTDGHRPTEYRWTLGSDSVQNLDTSEASNPGQPDPPEVSNPCDGSVQTSEPSPITNPREPNEEQPNAALALVSADPFDAMWEAYPPRKGGKQAARKAWDRTVKAGADPTVLLAAVGHYGTCRTAWGQAEARFTKHAATFFGPDRHWEDWVAGVPPGEMPVRKESRGERDLRLLSERRAARAEPNLMMRELLP